MLISIRMQESMTEHKGNYKFINDNSIVLIEIICIITRKSIICFLLKTKDKNYVYLFTQDFYII